MKIQDDIGGLPDEFAYAFIDDNHKNNTSSGKKW